MKQSKDKTSRSLFDSLISELINSDSEHSMLDICLYGSQQAIQSVPLRFRLIALGFVKRLSLEEVNSRLIDNGCEKLYARSLLEASLIYAFSNGLTYEEWKEINAEASMLQNQVADDNFMSEGSVSLAKIHEYVEDNSICKNEILLTIHKTHMMEEQLSGSKITKSDFTSFLLSNIASFCSYREKSRYYFCKYLMYYLETQKNHYLRSLEMDSYNGSALNSLSSFKSVTALRRRKHSIEEADKLLSSTGISFSAIYQSFQDFYFEYTSTDWLEVLLDKYGEINKLLPRQKAALASYIRRHNPEMSALSDEKLLAWKEQEITDREIALDNGTSYQTNRAGEKFLRKTVRGEIDLDRTTLMAFLLFFDSTSNIPKEHQVDQNRLSGILSECGFSGLNSSNYIDDFFMDYMSTDDPVTFLIEEAEIMAMSEENFYLYKTYLDSKNSENEWQKITSTPRYGSR